MLTKVISLGTVVLLLSCAAHVEREKAGNCTVTRDPTGWHGKIEVSCPEVSFTLIYDNSPDGRDPLVVKIKGIKAEKVSGRFKDHYVVETGDYEELQGWRYEEEWRVGGFTLKGYEYFVSGGTACYEEEEKAVLELHLKDRKLVLLDHYREETDCGGN